MIFRDHILSIVIFLPIAASILLLLVPREWTGFARWFSLIAAVATFVVSLPLFFWFKVGSAAMQFQEYAPWIRFTPASPVAEIGYHLGVDGISLFLVLLTTFLTPLAMLASWKSITDRVRTFYFALLLLEGAMLGVFLSLDLILFYIFWDAMLIPMYFIIGIWGYERRVYASIKFFIYTLVGSLLMLAAIIYLGLQHPDGTTFDYLRILESPIARAAQFWLFLAFGLAFAIKIPIFPLHTWLPDAHTEAPTAGSVILAGILLKMGAYGFLRFCLPLFPVASVTFGPYLAALGIIGILYGALVAFAQPDAKRLIAYSSVSHLGFVVLGIFAFSVQGILGALVVMIAHGLSTGALFLAFGMLYERRHTRFFADYGGVWKQMPVFGGFLMIAALASLGLPGLSNFPGEFLVILSAFHYINWLAAGLAAFGVVFAAVYVLRLYGDLMQGPTDKPDVIGMRDLSAREILVLAPVVIFIVLMGLFPGPILSRSQASAESISVGIRRAIAADGSKVVRAEKGSKTVLGGEKR